MIRRQTADTSEEVGIIMFRICLLLTVSCHPLSHFFLLLCWLFCSSLPANRTGREMESNNLMSQWYQTLTINLNHRSSDFITSAAQGICFFPPSCLLLFNH